MTEDVLDHENRAIHEDAEIDRADRQQVGRRALKIEAEEREQQCERDGDGDDQSRTKIVEKEDQDHDHQQHALQQVALDNLGRLRDQIAQVVERMNPDILREDVIVEFLRLRFDPFQDILGFFAGAQQDDALHRVVLFFVSELAQARCDTDHHTADIL